MVTEKLWQKWTLKIGIALSDFISSRDLANAFRPAILCFPRICPTVSALMCSVDLGIKGQLYLLGIEMCLPSNP